MALRQVATSLFASVSLRIPYHHQQREQEADLGVTEIKGHSRECSMKNHLRSNSFKPPRIDTASPWHRLRVVLGHDGEADVIK